MRAVAVSPVPLSSLEKVDLILQSCLKVPACLLEVVPFRSFLFRVSPVVSFDDPLFCICLCHNHHVV